MKSWPALYRSPSEWMQMTVFAHHTPALLIRTAERLRIDDRTIRVLTLVPVDNGWSLIGPGGDEVFYSAGRAGRRKALEFALAQGVLVIRS